MSTAGNAVAHCLVCHCRLKLDASLKEAKEDDIHDDPVLAALDNTDLEWSGFVQSGNLLELICNAKTPLQAPMCKKCSTTVSSELNNQLSLLEKECLSYKSTLEELSKKRNSSPFDPQTAKDKMDELQREEDRLIAELENLECEGRKLMDEVTTKQEEQKELSERDEIFYRKLRDNHRALIELSEEEKSLKAQIDYADEQIKRLARVNVLDMAFFIWMDGDYGTINGLRLGRLPHDLVEWYEINAAFGQISLLLTVMAEQLDLVFTDYDIIPCGSHSFLKAKNGGDKDELPLYGNGGWRPFGQAALDQGIVAFMECFREFEAKIKTHFQAGTQILPYRMTKDKIIDQDSQYLVKMQLNSEERWTKAMKCLLVNLKWSVKIIANLRRTSSSNATS